MATWFQSMRTNVRVDFHLKMAVHSWLGLAIPGSVSCLFSVITHTSRVCAVCVYVCAWFSLMFELAPFQGQPKVTKLITGVNLFCLYFIFSS